MKDKVPAKHNSENTPFEPVFLEFDDNALIPLLFGEHDLNLSRLEKLLRVKVSSRGNQIAIVGPPENSRNARKALKALYQRLKKGLSVGEAEIDAAVRLVDAPRNEPGLEALTEDRLAIVTRKRHVTPRSARQAKFIKALWQNEMVFGIGPAGTGKTYLAVATAVSMLISGKVDRIILSRPAVEAGERLGFLPGAMKEKIDPYLRPLYDALHDMLPGEQVIKRLESGDIEIAPLAFMRGRTLSNSFIILDEAQNTTPVQMKMFLTRLGENSRMAITGDMSQVDLPVNAQSGLRDAVDLLANIDGIGFVQFTDADVVRHALVTNIVRAYEQRDKGPSVKDHLFENEK